MTGRAKSEVTDVHSIRTAAAVRRGRADAWPAAVAVSCCGATICVGGAAHPSKIALREPNWPARTQQVGNCFANQFELPVLFYVLTILAIITRHADVVFVVLAWVFVLSRLAHAIVHTTSNRVMRRGSLVRLRRAGADRGVAHLHRPHSARPAMTPAARLAAAIEVFATIESERRPAADALKAWGLDASLCRLRRPRGDCRSRLRRAAPARLERLAHGRRYAARRPARHAQARARARNARRSRKLADGAQYAPDTLSEDERSASRCRRHSTGAPPHVAGDYPEWLDAAFRARLRRRARAGGRGACPRARRSTCASIR